MTPRLVKVADPVLLSVRVVKLLSAKLAIESAPALLSFTVKDVRLAKVSEVNETAAAPVSLMVRPPSRALVNATDVVAVFVPEGSTSSTRHRSE